MFQKQNRFIFFGFTKPHIQILFMKHKPVISNFEQCFVCYTITNQQLTFISGIWHLNKKQTNKQTKQKQNKTKQNKTKQKKT